MPLLINCQKVAQKYLGTGHPHDILADVLADMTGDKHHARLTRWTLNRLNVEVEAWRAESERQETIDEYRDMMKDVAPGKGGKVACTIELDSFMAQHYSDLMEEVEDDGGP